MHSAQVAGSNIDAQADPQPIKVLDSIMSDELKDKTYQALGQSKKGNNIRDIVKNLEGFEQLNLHQYFKDGRFLAPVALFDSLNPVESKASDENHSFIGPCYNQGNSKLILNKIKDVLTKNQAVKNIYWLAPDDAFGVNLLDSIRSSVLWGNSKINKIMKYSLSVSYRCQMSEIVFPYIITERSFQKTIKNIFTVLKKVCSMVILKSS
jgi:hypothetical protein